MTLVMNQLLDSKLTKDSKGKEKVNKTIEKQEEDTMFLWDGVSLFDTEGSILKPENIPTAKKEMDLIIKDHATISKIKKLQNNVKRQIMTMLKMKHPKSLLSTRKQSKPTNNPSLWKEK